MPSLSHHTESWLSLHSEEVPANGTPLSVLILLGSPHSWNNLVNTTLHGCVRVPDMAWQASK